MRNSPLKGLVRKGNSQGLNPEALANKRANDLAAAKTKKRKDRKAENQSDETPEQSSNYDLHHKPDGSVVRMSTKNNRNVWKHGERT
jgi:hypothetical protein